MALITLRPDQAVQVGTPASDVIFGNGLIGGGGEASLFGSGGNDSLVEQDGNGVLAGVRSAALQRRSGKLRYFPTGMTRVFPV